MFPYPRVSVKEQRWYLNPGDSQSEAAVGNQYDAEAPQSQRSGRRGWGKWKEGHSSVGGTPVGGEEI